MQDKPEYSNVVLDHIKNPRNVGVIQDPDGVALVGDPSCGDSLKIYIKVENDIITDVAFQVLGCGAAIASASMATVMLKGLSLTDALKISNNDIVRALGGLPDKKVHCSVMAEEAIVRAVDDYRTNFNAMYQGQDLDYPYLFGDMGCVEKCICSKNSDI